MLAQERQTGRQKTMRTFELTNGETKFHIASLTVDPGPRQQLLLYLRLYVVQINLLCNRDEVHEANLALVVWLYGSAIFTHGCKASKRIQLL